MSSQSVSDDTFFHAERSLCLSSSSVFGAGSLYVVLSKIIQMVSREFTSREFAGRSSFAIKFPNPSGTMSSPFSFQGFPTFNGHTSSYRCAWNFETVKLNFVTFLSCRIITHTLTAFSITFLTHLNKKKKTVIHSLVCLLKSLLLTTCSLISFRLVKQFSNFCDWMARRP